MVNQCRDCGERMKLTLRKVVYQKVVDIENVPVYTCPECERNHVLENIKLELTDLIRNLGEHPCKLQVKFEEHSSFTRLLVSLKENDISLPDEQKKQDHINELLDLYLLAQSLKDESWVTEISTRLKRFSS
jgi:hypothetical protein